jgi:hypothetical protein
MHPSHADRQSPTSWRWITVSGAPSPASSTARVPQLVRRESAPHAGLGGEPPELDAHARTRPRPPVRRAVDDAEQRPDRKLNAGDKPRPQLRPAPGVDTDLAAPTGLAVAHQQRPAPPIEVALAERQRLLHSQPPRQSTTINAQPEAVAIVAGPAHHRDDLLHRRRVRRTEPPLVARRTAGAVTRQRRRRAPPTGGTENWHDGHGISSQSHSGRSPLPYQPRCQFARCRFAPTQPKSGGSLSRRPTLVRSGRLRTVARRSLTCQSERVGGSAAHAGKGR